MRNTPLLFGDLEPPGNPNWNLLLILLHIINSVFSPVVTYGMTVFLKHLISEHHQLFKLVYPQKRLIPKHYFMVHYPLCIRKIGPLLHFWSMRFEENKLFKNMLKSFKNITKSLVKKTSNGNRKSLGNAQFTAERIWTNELFLSVTMKMVKTWQMLCKSHYRQTFTQLV